jgi:replicative DNA helicase
MTLSSLEGYGHQFQIKVLSALLTDKKLLTNVSDIISDKYFDNQALKWIIQQILNYYDKYNSTPTLDILKVELQKVENQVLQVSIKEQLKLAYTSSDDDLEYVKEEFTNFCKNQQLKKALLSSVDLLKVGDYDSIRSLVDDALKSGQDKNVGHEYNKNIEDRFREDERHVIPTPWDKINDILQGGLGNGDFGLLFGSPGGGKSWGLVALGGEAVKLGYNVIHYTLELGETYVGKRYDAFFSKIEVDQLKDRRKEIENIIPEISGQLIIKEYPTSRATINTIESHIQKVKDQSFEPDLIIIDYVDLLSSPRRNTERKGEIDDVYLSTKGLARELNIPIWSVSQVNRLGSQDKIVEGDKAAGSYDKIMITDFCISLSRKRQDKVNGTGRFHVMKNRYGIDGITYGAKINIPIGEFLVEDYNEDEEITESSSQPTQPQGPVNNFHDFDKLKSKFFELNSE